MSTLTALERESAEQVRLDQRKRARRRARSGALTLEQVEEVQDDDAEFARECGIFLLSDLLRDETLLRPPEPILAHLAWAGRLTLLAAAEKSGKSTLAGHCAAAMITRQEFLGTVAAEGGVLWYALDEPVIDVVQRFKRYGVTPELAASKVVVCTQRPKIAEIEILLEEYGCKLVVIDSLSQFAQCKVKVFNDSEDWTPVFDELRVLAQKWGAAFVLLHHATKSNGGYRNSSAIGAGVDVIVEMGIDERDLTRRSLKCIGRIPVKRDLSIRYAEPWYNLDGGGELSLETRVLLVIQASTSGLSKRSVRSQVSGRAASIDAALDALERRGAIQKQGAGSAQVYTTTRQPELGELGHGQGHGTGQ